MFAKLTNGDFPIKNGDLPIKNDDFPLKIVIFLLENGDFPIGRERPNFGYLSPQTLVHLLARYPNIWLYGKIGHGLFFAF